jgi:hypothetical protein
MNISTNDLYTAAYFTSLHAFLGRSDIKPLSGEGYLELAMNYAHVAATKVVEQFNANGKN